MEDSTPDLKLIGYLASCRSRLDLYVAPAGTPEAETVKHEFNSLRRDCAGSRSVYSAPDPNAERCVISLRDGIEM